MQLALVLATVDAIPTPTPTVACTAGEVLKRGGGRSVIMRGHFGCLLSAQASHPPVPPASRTNEDGFGGFPCHRPLLCFDVISLWSARPQLPARGSFAWFSARNCLLPRAVEDDNFSDRRAVWASRFLTLSSLGCFVCAVAQRRRRRRRGRTGQGSPSLEDWR